jgi:hypothetical protein
MAATPVTRTPKRISNARAVLVGTTWVNLPVILIMGGGYIGGRVLFAHYNRPLWPGVLAILLLALFVATIMAGWLWWSFNIPKWRLWALERTEDWPSLERAAIWSGLIWNENSYLGRMFARTEIWSPAQRRREADLRLHHHLSPKDF